MSVMILMASVSDYMSGSSASLSLYENVYSDENRGRFQKGAYEFSYESAYVAQGSYSGIRTTFRTSEAGDDYHELVLFVPSHGEFQVGYLSSNGTYELKTPSTPFTLKAEETTGVTDRFDRPRPLMVELCRWKRVARDQVSKKSVSLSGCNIHVESMSISEGKLNFYGNFGCEPDGQDNIASGTFTIVDGKLGVSKVD